MKFEYNSSERLDAFLIVDSKVFPLKNGITTIGRTLDNDLIIQDSTVSRHHAEIEAKGDTFILRDLQSSSGTYLNKNRIDKCALYSGDLILLANVPVVFISQGFKINDEAHNPTTSLYGMKSAGDNL